MKRNSLVLLAFFGCMSLAHARLQVVATLPDFAALTTEIGGEWVDVKSIAKGTQDPHFIEAKPSFMRVVHDADLVIANGLELEVGWLPSILRGARNPKVMEGNPGFLDLGASIQALDIPRGSVSRADGDVHASGNPHYNLDPIRMGDCAQRIADRLGQLDASHSQFYLDKAVAFRKRMIEKTKAWTARIKASGVHQVVTYHKSFTYFFNRFGITSPAMLEPKPGIPPTSTHILEVIRILRDQKVPLILVENYFDPTVTERIRQDLPSVRSKTVAIQVGGDPEIKTYDDLIEKLVQAVESASGRGRS